MHIVITRPKEDSLSLIEKLKKLGHLVTHLPVIKIEKLKTKKINLDNYKAVIFTSSNAIRYMNYFGINSYLFMDMGVMDQNYQNNDLSFSSIHMDAGIGFTLELSRLWDSNIDADPLILRLDFPLILNKPPAGQDYLDFRCVFGINRAF